jgi:hypothetical protein
MLKGFLREIRSNWPPTRQSNLKFNTMASDDGNHADFSACGLAPPNPHGDASSQHYGRCPNASVWPDSTVGASNWGGSAKRIKSIFFHTTINWAKADCISNGAVSPNPLAAVAAV